MSYLDDLAYKQQGIVVFDELDITRSKILLNQMAEYFLNTWKGKIRANQIIPEPFFVHSHLTTLIQIADLIAYIVSWGFRIGGSMTKPSRIELSRYSDLVASLRYRTERELSGTTSVIWSFSYIDDLRGKEEKEEFDFNA